MPNDTPRDLAADTGEALERAKLAARASIANLASDPGALRLDPAVLDALRLVRALDQAEWIRLRTAVRNTRTERMADFDAWIGDPEQGGGAPDDNTDAGAAAVLATAAATPTEDSLIPVAVGDWYLALDWWMFKGDRHPPGVYRRDEIGKKDRTITIYSRVCPPLRTLARLIDHRREAVGRVLWFIDEHDQEREFVFAAADAQGEMVPIRAALADRGFIVPAYAWQAFGNLLTAAPIIPGERGPIRCADRTGWATDTAGWLAFVLPDRTIGGAVRLHTEHTVRALTVAGTLAEWREHVASKAKGNPVPLLVIAAAFAGPLLKIARSPAAGLHVIGKSSTGKTSTAAAGASVWSDPGEMLRSWNVTVSGIEGAAAESSDGLLVLDEMASAEPHEIVKLVYSLGNGTGRQRANVRGGARKVRTWRTFVLSTGERTVEEVARLAGVRFSPAGVGVRLLHVRANREHGIFDALPAGVTGRQLADALSGAALQYHGTAGPAFIEKLVAENDLAVTVRETMATARAAIGVAHSEQEGRALTAFAMIAAAGELATRYEITGWDKGAATASAQIAFDLWREDHPGNTEDRQAIEAVRDFLARYGEASFTTFGGEPDDATASTPPAARDFRRRGWYLDTIESPGREIMHRDWYVLPEAMREALAGLNFRTSLAALVTAGMLTRKENGETQTLVRMGGDILRVYVVRLT